MKRKRMILIAMAVAVISGYNLYVAQSQKVISPDFLLGNLEVLAQGESGNYSCTATVECGFPMPGSVSCSGQKCSRGMDWSKGSYVECDVKRTYC